jgi:hypothetical protein
MKVPQGNSLCSYLKQPKMSFLLLLVFLYIIRKQEGTTDLAWGFGTHGRGEEMGKW